MKLDIEIFALDLFLVKHHCVLYMPTLHPELSKKHLPVGIEFKMFQHHSDPMKIVPTTRAVNSDLTQVSSSLCEFHMADDTRVSEYTSIPHTNTKIQTPQTLVAIGSTTCVAILGPMQRLGRINMLCPLTLRLRLVLAKNFGTTNKQCVVDHCSMPSQPC